MKNLPIQLVEFRERQDDFLAEGGGQDVLQSWITDNIDSEYQTESAIWYEDIKKIAGDEQKEINLFFSLSKQFYADYKNKKGYFEMMN